MIALKSVRHLFATALAILGLAGIMASIGLLATALPALAAEKTADLAGYCRKHHGRTAFPNVDRRDDGLMCSRRTNRGRGLLHRKIAAADVCADLYRTRRYRRRGKGLVCITGSGGARTAKTIDLNKHCRARYGRRAFVTRRRADNRPMCTIRTNRGRGLRHHLINLAGLCGGGSPRAVGNKLRCGGNTAGKPGTGAANRGPLPTPRRKGGGRLSKADFRGCSNDTAITRRKVAMPGWLRRPGHAYLHGAVPTPCPRLAGGRIVDLAGYCRKRGNKGLVFLDGRIPTCFGPPGRVSSRRYPTPAEWKGWLRGSGRKTWGRPLVLLSPCGWGGGITTRKKSKELFIVFKYAKRRLECFYFKRARYMAIWKPGKGARAPNIPITKPAAPKITMEY